MRAFFKPWRRKFGVVVLLMSCLFVIGWARSLTFNETVMIQFRQDWTDGFTSYDSSLIWTCTRTSLTSGIGPVFSSERRSDDAGFWKLPFVRRWQLLGFGNGVDDGGLKTIGRITLHTSPSRVTVVPYWSVVFSLTVISLWLMLSKPRPSNQKKIEEPVPYEKALGIGDFLKPWRSRIGVTTLVVACVFAAGWVRSIFLADGISFVRDKRQYQFISGDGNISFAVWRYLNADMGPNSGPVWGTSNSVKSTLYDSSGPISISSKQFGFEPFPVIQMVSNYVLISYWIIVIPLTLLSLRLLLSKPRKSNQKKITESTPPLERDAGIEQE